MRITDLFMLVVVIWAFLNSADTLYYIIMGCGLVYALGRIVQLIRR